MRQFLILLAAAIALPMCFADLVRAQDAPNPPPYPAIFGGSVKPNARESLDLSTSIFEGYDTNQTAIPSTVFGPGAFQTDSAYTGLMSDLTFGIRERSFDIRATAGTNLRYFSELDRVVALSNHGAVNIFFRGRNTKVGIGESISYLPANVGGLFVRPVASTDPAADNVLPSPDYYASSANKYINYGTSGTVEHRVSRRGTVLVNLDASYTHYISSQPVADLNDLPSYRAGGRYSYQVDRNVSLVTGYTFGRAKYSQGVRPINQHDIGLGVSYERPLSATRQMTFQFALGSTFYGTASPDETAELVTANDQGLQKNLMASASVSRPIGRSWNLTGSYYRGLSYVSSLVDAAFNDSMTVTASGFLNRRIDLTASGSYAWGSFPRAPTTASDYSTYTADIRARFALNGGLAAFVDYFYYYYLFDNGVALASGLPPGLTRNSIQGGITLWLPIVTHH